ncbi:hypothetical protein Tco_0917620 [Tanacetum coccineum]
MAPMTRRGPNTPINNTNPNNMTPESIKAMIDQALLRNSTNGDGSHSSHGDNRRTVQTARPCFYAEFMKCQPLNFKGTEGVVGLTRWIKKMESVFNISGYAIENQVKFATCTLLGAALTWWNGQIRTLGPEAYAMTWEVLKKKMMDKYCPQGEIKKLEIEMWNLKVKGKNDKQPWPTIKQTFTRGTNVAKSLQYGDRRNESLMGIFAKEHQVPSYTNMAPCTQSATSATNRAFLLPMQETITQMLLITQKAMGSASPGKCWECRKERKCIGKPECQCRAGSLINIAPTPLENCYDVELADGKLVGIDTIIRGCTLNFLDHPFNIDLMPVELCTLAKGCHVFFGAISAKKEEDKSKGKQIKDVPIVRDFFEVFPEDLPGLPPALPVEFQIDLIPGAAPVARAPYRLAPSEMKELSEKLQELSDKGFIRGLVPHLWEPPVLVGQKEGGSSV